MRSLFAIGSAPRELLTFWGFFNLTLFSIDPSGIPSGRKGELFDQSLREPDRESIKSPEAAIGQRGSFKRTQAQKLLRKTLRQKKEKAERGEEKTSEGATYLHYNESVIPLFLFALKGNGPVLSLPENDHSKRTCGCLIQTAVRSLPVVHRFFKVRSEPSSRRHLPT